jgi:hypothetical protein
MLNVACRNGGFAVMPTVATAIPRSHKIFYAVILVAALVVAAGGLLVPGVLASTFSWFVLPPLHANFLGAIYLFGTLYMLDCLRARWQAEVRFALPLIAIFTGMLFVVSILNLGAFDFGKAPVLIWLASYIVYPLVAIVLFLRVPRPWPADPARPGMPEWAHRFLFVQGTAVSLLAVGLFVLPDQMASAWPCR